MQEPKKDESVKTGLEIAAHKVTQTGAEKDAGNVSEKDPDDLVHEQGNDLPEDASGKDPDELVHEHQSKTVDNNMEERDPDDLVHEKGSDEIEEG